MKKKVLFVATEGQGHINKFHLPYLKRFQEMGYEVHVACGGNDEIPYCDRKITLPVTRQPLRLGNLAALFQLKKEIDTEMYDLVHCHTPVGGVIGRLAAKRARKQGTKVLYTAHGFHFYKGASRLAWMVYYPVEKCLSRLTDCLITINKEDYELAKQRGFHAKRIAHVHGVGIDLNKFHSVSQEEKRQLREEYEIHEDAFVLMLAADYNQNKNQKMLIQTVERLKAEMPQLLLLLVGEGVLESEYRALVDTLGLADHVRILGFRKDVWKLLQASDLAVSSSFREGLPVFVMEAMATGLPLVATDCRGNRDLVIDGKNGRLVGIDNLDEFTEAVRELSASEEVRKAMGEAGRTTVQAYDLQEVLEEMREVYQACLTE